MKPLTVGMWLFVAVYGGYLVLHATALAPSPGVRGVAWYVWHVAGAVCLAAAASERVVRMVWYWLRRTGAPTTGGVTLRLTPLDRMTLLRERPPVALLMPARNEATTEADREGLAERICETLLRTPSYSTFFLLADSPASERANELDVVRRVKQRLCEGGRGYCEDRIVLEEYRNKPPILGDECGSMLMWMSRYGGQFPYMFVLDPHSSLPQPDPRRPETCDVIERMTLALHGDLDLALVRGSFGVRDARTLWGRVRDVNSLAAARYCFRAFPWPFGRRAPGHGRHCLIRVEDFAAYVRNSLYFTSDDCFDSAEPAADRRCAPTDKVMTYGLAAERQRGRVTRGWRSWGTLLQGISLLPGAFGSRWIARGAGRGVRDPVGAAAFARSGVSGSAGESGWQC